MTCIAAVVHNGHVWMAGDSAASAGHDVLIREEPKVFHNGPLLIGTCGSPRIGQLLRYRLRVPREPDESDDWRRWVVVDLIDSVRTAIGDGGAKRTWYGEEAAPASGFLVGWRDRLFWIDSDFQIGTPASSYAADGCGAPYALGALHALTGSLPPKKLLKAALLAAADHSGAVAEPFTVLSTKDTVTV